LYNGFGAWLIRPNPQCANRRQWPIA
jgi:hypothetical protein